MNKVISVLIFLIITQFHGFGQSKKDVISTQITTIDSLKIALKAQQALVLILKDDLKKEEAKLSSEVTKNLKLKEHLDSQNLTLNQLQIENTNLINEKALLSQELGSVEQEDWQSLFESKKQTGLDIFRYHLTPDFDTLSSDWKTFQLYAYFNFEEKVIDEFVSNDSKFDRISKSEYKELEIPSNAYEAVMSSFPNGKNSTELISYCIINGSSLKIYGKTSYWPNLDNETFNFKLIGSYVIDADYWNSLINEKKNKIQFKLQAYNKQEAAAASINFQADYLIKLVKGNETIAVFGDSGEGSLSEENDEVFISTDVPSYRTYSYKEEGDEIFVTCNFQFEEGDSPGWTKTYKKDDKGVWKLIECNGACD